MKSISKVAIMSSLLALAGQAAAAPTVEELWDIIQKQQKEIEQLKKEQSKTDATLKITEEKVEATADAVEQVATGSSLSGSKAGSWAEKTTIGGYGEHHYNNFNGGKNDSVDAHRYVLYVGHEYSDKVRFFSEWELEHGLSGDGQPGEVELEQAFIEWDYADKHSFVVGQYLIPVGFLNEIHEPDTFYGVERNLIEKNIIPTTWWETGVMFKGDIAPGVKYEFAMHSGLKMDGGDKVRSGRQKSAKATANDFAYTGRVSYTGVPGLNLAAAVQYQEDVLQNNEGDSASAVLTVLNASYEKSIFSVRALWAEWNIDNDAWETNERDVQNGWFVEPSIKPLDDLGFFVRYSNYNNEAGENPDVSDQRSVFYDVGVNYWLTERVVFKADYQAAHEDNPDSDNYDSFNLGVGWSF
ncbi:porin [Teredinibacter sp. KSP-S5-2]|uniref:porin n=1 Tax=Teredinibacter sp. KSP-S5-2 TaxID=3034506 RepID=UPI002934B839|nr:porin [Teredinibacter sp. KSP-S5-2]WNO10174.1 porin [Teredinibacter sp. KSP-S5-2]